MTHQLPPEKQLPPGSERLLDGLRKDAERRGWEFHVEPSNENIPDFVEGYRPDAIAITPEGGVIIEITSRRDLDKKDRFAEIAKKISEHSGWSLRVFYVNPSDQLETSILSLTYDSIILGINETRALNEIGQERAALVMGWSTLEAIALLIMNESNMTPVKALSPIQAIQVLVQEGYLADEDAGRLRYLARLRNEVVHGGLNTMISREEVTEFIRNLESTASSLVRNPPS